MQEKIEKFFQYMEASNYIIFFGGAGVSTESGIPDFRSKDGLYNQHDIQFEKYHPEYLLSADCLYHESAVFYEFYRQKMNVEHIEPNITHKTLVKLEEMGKLNAIITQNIDGLHQKAGSKCVYEIHGTTQRNYCCKCKKNYPADYLFHCEQAIPKCECGGLIRPDVTLYGENLPEQAVYHAINAIRNSDLLIIAGTSLQVYPAASFIHEFKGDHLVVINKEKLNIDLNEKQDLFFCANMGQVFEKLNLYIR